MEPFLRESGKLQGIEVLYFPDAEIQKTRGDKTSFAGFGGLSILHFKDLNRFVLQLNDWRYPLLRRLTISSSAIKDDPSSRSYVLPASNGFSYELKISKVANSQAFDNLDTILDNNSRFSTIGKEIAYRKLEASPEIRKNSFTGPKEVIGQTLKKMLTKVQNTAATLKSGTKHLTSRKEMIDLDKVKTKNFKKDAKSRIKKDFFESSEKKSKEFLQKRKDNPNLSQKKDFDQLKGTDANLAPSLYICKEELEEAIHHNRSIFSYLEANQKPEKKKGLQSSLREGSRSIRDRVSNFMTRRGIPEVQTQPDTLPTPEGLGHYQG